MRFTMKKDGISAVELFKALSELLKSYVLCLLLFLVAGAGLPTAVAQSSDTLLQIIEQSRASDAIWSIQVRDLDGNLLEDLNGNYIMRPASNFKLISSAAFLHYLGPDYRFKTRLYGNGMQRNDTWEGDLIVIGSGDPTIDGTFYSGNAMYVFERWAEALQEKGIKKISGNLLGLDGYFDDVPYPKGWEWDDLTYYYAPEINALSFNRNVVDLEVRATGRPGTLPEIRWFPYNTSFVEFINEQQTSPPGTSFKESYRRILGTNTILLRSTLPQGYYETEPLTITAPSSYFLDTFRKHLSTMGIEVQGHVSVNSEMYGVPDDQLFLIHEHVSVPLSEIIKEINRESNNFYSEMLLKAMAAETFSTQGTTELGLEKLLDYMEYMKFDTSSISIRDASGMAPATLVKTSDLNQFLVGLSREKYFPYLFESLAVSGHNGTLGHRFKSSPVNGKFSGKTGFVSGVRALSGYLNTADSRQLAVTILTNNYTIPTSNVDLTHQKILEYLYQSY